MKEFDWKAAFVGLAIAVFLGWAGWVSLTLISRGEIIMVSEMRLQKVEAQIIVLLREVFTKDK
jgi:hypothetical protein